MQVLCQAVQEDGRQNCQILNKEHTTWRHQSRQVFKRGLRLVFRQATQKPVHDDHVVRHVMFVELPKHGLNMVFGFNEASPPPRKLETELPERPAMTARSA